MDEIPELTVPEVAARLGQPNVFVFDNNSAARWTRSHVPGAKHVNAYNFDASVLPADKTATLVFYCSGPG
ncbi:MAG TPA: rhodanese-like domain-containing protein [Kofleriaceae bacterium]|jgi:rhodanese-related sulfurtransferase